METLIIHSENEKIKGIIALLKAFDISFEIKKEKPYDSEFVKKILATKNEKATRINPHKLWESIS
jgi:cytochrome c556